MVGSSTGERDAPLVLAVCDEPDCLLLTRVNLEFDGWEVVTAAHGEEGVAMAQRLLPDVVLLDVMMPVMHGWDALQLLKQLPETAHIPVVMCTAKVQEEDIARGYDLGCSDYITKPYSPLRLVERLGAQVDRPAPQRPRQGRADAVDSVRWLLAQPDVLDPGLRRSLLDMEFEVATDDEQVDGDVIHLRGGCTAVDHLAGAAPGLVARTPATPQRVALGHVLADEPTDPVCAACLDTQLRFGQGRQLRPLGGNAGTLVDVAEGLRDLLAVAQRFDEQPPPSFVDVPWDMLAATIEEDRGGPLRDAVLDAREQVIDRMWNRVPHWLLVRYAVDGSSPLAHTLRVGLDPAHVLRHQPDAMVGYRGEQVSLDELLDRVAEDHASLEHAAVVVRSTGPLGTRMRSLHPTPPVAEGDGWYVMSVPANWMAARRRRSGEDAITLPRGWQQDERLLQRLAVAAAAWVAPGAKRQPFSEVWREHGGTLFDATGW